MRIGRTLQGGVLAIVMVMTMVSVPGNARSDAQDIPGAPPGVVVMLTAALSGFSDQRADMQPRVSNVQFLESDEMRGIEMYTTDAADCRTGAINEFGPKAEAQVSWGVEGRAMSVNRDMITLDLHWTRRVVGAGFYPGESVEMRQKVTLRDGQSRPFDLVRTGESGPDACQWYVTEYGVELLDPPEVEDAQLEYDLWLVHRERDGRQVTERLRQTARQGGAVAYEFPPLFHTSEGVLLDGESEGALKTLLFGEIKGRARRDGLIDLTVDTKRSVRIESGGTMSTGRKLLTLKPGETVEVQLPPPRGDTFRTERGTIVLDAPRVFAGQSTAIRITTTRIR
jgi:hypothetical protein